MITFRNIDQVETTESESPGSVTAAKSENITEKQIFFITMQIVFTGIGCIVEPYHIKIDPDAVPVVHPPRKIPVTLRNRVEEELENIEQQGMIKKVTEPTSWNNSVVVNKKKLGKLKICIDPKDLNSYVKTEYYQLPSQEDIICRLAGVKYFSKLDDSQGLWQIPLDNESSYLTTFNTPHGRYHFTVILFGFNFAQEVLHRTVNDKFADISGRFTDFDDILVVGRTLAEHDTNLKKVLDCVREIVMTLNKEKCQFSLTQTDYLGETLSQEGVKPDNQKIKAIFEYRTPECKTDVLSLLEMFNLIAKFAPEVLEVTTPLRQPAKRHVAFHWEQIHEKAFNDLKSLLSNPDRLR